MEVEDKTANVDVEEAFIVKTDADELCRLCANTDNQLIPIFRGEGLDHNIPVKIEKHLPIIKVTEVDKLPLQICYQCASTLISWHNLYEGCRVADKRLRDILSVDDKLCQEDEAFGDYVDDYRDDYDDTHETLPSSTNTSNLESNPLKDNPTEISTLSDTKAFNETELDTSDERCLRWSDCDSGDDDDDDNNDYDYEYYYNDDDDQLTKVAQRSSSQKQRRRRRDANIPGTSKRPALSGRMIDDGVCGCVLSRNQCDRCVKLNRFKCHYCPMVFLKLDERNRHLRVSHRKELLKNSFELFCKAGQKGRIDGGEVADEVDLVVDHQFETRYECDKCAYTFADKVALIRHLDGHRQRVQQQQQEGEDDDHDQGITCLPDLSDDIDDRVTTTAARQKHAVVLPRRQSKRTRSTRARTSSRKKPSLAIADEEVTYECAHCVEIFKSEIDIIRHLGLMHDFKISRSPDRCSPHTAKKEEAKLIRELANKSFKRSEAGPSTSAEPSAAFSISSAAGYYICAVCGQIFLKRHSFTRHVNLHSSSRYDCDKCKKTFTTNGALVTHKNLKHKDLPKNMFFLNGRKYLKCEQCSFTCRNERNKMEEHLRVHTGEKPFTCELCGKQFRTRALLRVHTRFVHEGVKEHACDICGRCFSNKRYMEEHRRIHTGEKPLICDLCGKTFRQNSSLSKHVENHLGIKKHGCHLCGKRFSNSHHLSIHIKRHMGETNHFCDQCGKGFVDQYQLKNHKVVHSEERPFACVLCGQAFKLLKHLKQHGRTHRTC